VVGVDSTWEEGVGAWVVVAACIAAVAVVVGTLVAAEDLAAPNQAVVAEAWIGT